MKNPQKILYEKIHNTYSENYYDFWSSKYREIFIYKKLFKNINFSEKNVIELACGEGHVTNYLLNNFNKIRVCGIDISDKAIKIYKRKYKTKGYIFDLTREFHLNEKFDYAIIVGGLHLCVNNIEQALKNISNLLISGGILFIFEPNSNFFLEPIRKYWYKRDKYFINNRVEALDHTIICKLNNNFECIFLNYLGGPGWLLICNSLIFRIPKFIKNIISPLLIIVEFFWNLLPNYFKVTFMARWKKIN